ncbi:unnamed protein product, partial [Adineta ricciae]
YADITNTSLQCRFDSNAIGIFNVSMFVTYAYGRSSTPLSSHQLSATGQLYTFQTYPVITSISPNDGSLKGGTTLTISGEYFSDNNPYPLAVNIANTPCTILSVNLTTIRCQISQPLNTSRAHYHGGRGFHMYSENTFIDLSRLGNSTPRMPGVNANKTWIDEASFSAASISNTTVWFIGYLRPPKTASFIFQLNTSVASVLYLSTNENPENIAQIANRTSSRSQEIFLNNNTK